MNVLSPTPALRCRPASNWVAAVAGIVLATSLAMPSGPVDARPSLLDGWLERPARATAPADGAEVPLAALPTEARRVHRLIERGGPFDFDRDGTTFGNRERRLPPRERGFYREYTVPTPGVEHRGARRIVCGGRPPSPPQVCYYTADHYASFRRIAP